MSDQPHITAATTCRTFLAFNINVTENRRNGIFFFTLCQRAFGGLDFGAVKKVVPIAHYLYEFTRSN